MKVRTALVATITAVAAITVLPGCAVTRGQSTVGEYIDDATVTAAVKTKLIENKAVDAAAIKVETLNGEVMLSGFAKSAEERTTAESLTRGTKGGRAVKNQIVVRS